MLVFAHPVHLSVSNISISDQHDSIAISIKCFTDDLNAATFQHLTNINKTVEQNSNNPPATKHIITYVKNNFIIHLNGIPHPLLNITIETDMETIRLKAFIFAEKEVNSIEIDNTLILNLYPDQTNMLVYSYGNKQQGIMFNYNKTKALIHIE